MKDTNQHWMKRWVIKQSVEVGKERTIEKKKERK